MSIIDELEIAYDYDCIWVSHPALGSEAFSSEVNAAIFLTALLRGLL